MLTFSVLGPVAAQDGGRPVELGPARRRTTLAALLVDVDRVVPVDTLVDRVWDGRAPANPVTTLHAYISRLRSGLRTGGADAPAGSPLLTEPPGYRLAVDPATVDAVAFVAATARADELHRDGEPAAAARSVQEATTLWRGEPYADISAGFAAAEADRLHAVRSTLREIGAEVDLALGRHALLIEPLRTLVTEEPLRERLHAALVLALYRSGRTAEALAAYERVRVLLADELGTDPGRDLQTLHLRVLQQDPALDVVAAAAGPGVPTSSAATKGSPDPRHGLAHGSTAVDGGFAMIGRDVELGRALEAVTRGGPVPRAAVVAVVGEAGIGKTRLLDEVAARVGPDTVVGWGRSWEHEGAPPLWPWAQALRSVAERLDPAVAAVALGGRAAPVAALDPALAALAASDPSAPSTPWPSDDLGELRVFDAVVAFLQAVGATRPALLVLEDVHWADAASRRLVEYVAAQVNRPGVAIALSVRTVDDDGGPTGSELLAALARGGGTTRIDLAGLAPDAVRDYVADRTGATLDDATSDALAERTGGNPFFVGELVRLIVTEGEADDGLTAGLTTAVPETVRDVVLRRVQRLPADDQTVLRAAAVVGRTFDLDLLGAVTELGDDEVDEAVDRATSTGLVSSEPGTPGRHRFFHALVQQSLLESTGPARRRRLHSRIARALLERRGDDTGRDAEQVVHHLAAAGGAQDLAAAGPVCIAGADDAHRRGNYAAAESLLVRAVELAGRQSGEQAERAEMVARTRLAALYTLSYHANFPGFAAMRERMTDLVRRLGSNLDLFAGLQGTYADGLYNGRFDLAENAVAEMLAVADADDDALMRLGGLHGRGLTAVHSGRPGPAADDLARAWDLADELGDTVPTGLTSVPVEVMGVWRLVALALLGRWDESDPDFTRVAVALRRGDVAAVANVEGVLATAYSILDDPERTQTHADRAVEVARAAGLGPVLMFISVTAGWARTRRTGAGLAELRAAHDLVPDQPGLIMRPYHRGLLADVLLRTGDPADAEEAAARTTSGLAESAVTGNRFWDAELHRLRAQAWARLGREHDDVAAELDRAVAVARSQGAGLLVERAEADRVHAGRSAAPARAR